MVIKTEYKTIREIAELLRVSQATVRRLVAAKKLPSLRVGRSIRLDLEAIRGLLAKGGAR